MAGFLERDFYICAHWMDYGFERASGEHNTFFFLGKISNFKALVNRFSRFGRELE
jgi:hypothetical protein